MSLIMKDHANKAWLTEDFDKHWNDEQRQPSKEITKKLCKYLIVFATLLISFFVISKIATANTPTSTQKADLSTLKSPDLVSYLKKYPQVITLYDIE